VAASASCIWPPVAFEISAAVGAPAEATIFLTQG
jgi:hypothetical protein